jgi:hypothetical protein
MPEVFDVGATISKLDYYKHSRHSREQIGVRSSNPENLQALVPKKNQLQWRQTNVRSILS